MSRTMKSLRFISTALVVFLSVVFPAFAEVPGTLAPTLQLRDVDGIAIPFQSGVGLIDFEPQDHPVLDLSGTWKKQRRNFDHDISFSERDEANLAAIEAGGRHGTGFDDSAWETHELPGVEDEMSGGDHQPPRPYHDGLWYRRSIEVPADWASRTNRFVCLSANYIFDLWINGQWVGVHEGGYTPFAFDVSDYLDYGTENQLAIRIDKPFPGLRQDSVPAWFLMDWWSYTGVIQDIYLESRPAIHIVRTNVIPQGYNGDLRVQVVVANDSGDDATVRVGIEAFHPDTQTWAYLHDPTPSKIVGESAAMEGGVAGDILIPAGGVRVKEFHPRIKSPLRWTMKEPHLYIMKAGLTESGQELHTHHTQFGIRSVDRGDGKLLINGRVAFLPGVARHEEWPDSGRTATWEKIRDDLNVIKELKALFIRSGHYPNHPHTFLLTDRLGFAVMEEIPNYWMMGWNWGYQNYRRVHLQMFREMIFAGYNRPSVILWGTNNECVFLWAHDIEYHNHMLANDMRLNYPDGRLITQSPAAGEMWSLMANTVRPLDVAGWTLYYGVFYGEEDAIYEETMEFLYGHRARFPEYPMIATEFGTWSSEEEGEDAQWQETAFVETFRAFADAGALDEDGNVNPDGPMAAMSWWAVFNWWTKSGLPNFIAEPHQQMGVIRMDRATWKLAAYAMAEAYEPYFEFGGLGPEPGDYVDDDDGDDDSGDDDSDDNDLSSEASAKEDDGGNCCG